MVEGYGAVSGWIVGLWYSRTWGLSAPAERRNRVSMPDPRDVVNSIGQDPAAAVQLAEDNHRRTHTVAVGLGGHIGFVKVGTLRLPVMTRSLFGL